MSTPSQAAPDPDRLDYIAQGAHRMAFQPVPYDPEAVPGLCSCGGLSLPPDQDLTSSLGAFMAHVLAARQD